MALTPKRFGTPNPFASSFDQEEVGTGSVGDFLLPTLADYEPPMSSANPKPSAPDPFDDSDPVFTPKPEVTPTFGGTGTGTNPEDPRISAPSLAGITTYDTPEESISAYAQWLKGQQRQSQALSAAAIESGDYSGLEGVDINAINRDPTRSLNEYSTQEVDVNLLDYIKENNIPPYKEVDGQKVFFNTGTDTSMPDLAASGDAHKSGGKYISVGPVGSYSTIWVPKLSTFDSILSIPALSAALSLVTGGWSNVIILSLIHI